MALKFRTVPDPELSYRPSGDCTSPRLLVWVDFNISGEPDQPQHCSGDGFELYPHPDGEYGDFRELALAIASGNVFSLGGQSGELREGRPGEIYFMQLCTRQPDGSWSERQVKLEELN